MDDSNLKDVGISDESSSTQDPDDLFSSFQSTLEKYSVTGDSAIESLEKNGAKLNDAKKKYRISLFFYIVTLIVIFLGSVIVFFYFSKYLIKAFIAILITLFIELITVFYLNLFDFDIPTSGNNWNTFKTSMLYDLRNINRFVDAKLKKKEHLLFIDQFKRKAKYTLSRYGLIEIAGVERCVDSFDSTVDDELSLMGSLSTSLAKLGISDKVFKLFYLEVPFPNNYIVFLEIKNSRNKELEKLQRILIDSGRVKLDLDIPFQTDILLSVLKTMDNFSFDKVLVEMDDKVVEVRKMKNTFKNLIKTYFPNRAVADIDEGIVYSSISDLETAYIEKISKVYGVDFRVIQFLFSTIQPSSTGTDLISELRKDDLFLESLCKSMLDEGVIRSNSKPRELVEILKGIRILTPEALQARISTYEDMLVLSRDFRLFLNNIGAKSIGEPLTTEEIFDLCNSVNDSFERTIQVARKLTSEYSIDKSKCLIETSDSLEAISKCILAVYLYRKQNSLLSNLCTRISSDRDAAGILYDYAVISDTEPTSSHGLERLLLTAISKYDRSKTSIDRYFLSFKEKLSVGVLYTSIMALDNYIMGQIRKDVHAINSKLTSVSSLEIFKKSLKDLLDDTLIGANIESLLDYGTVSAFILTKDTMSKGNVLPLVDELAEKHDISMEVGSGEHTRFGMIPKDVSFEEFSSRFEKLFKDEISRRRNDEISSSVSLNLYKFIPSRNFTKVIGIRDESPVIEVIGKLIKGKRFPSEEKLSILASLAGESESRKSVGSIISAAIDRINIIDLALERGVKEKTVLKVMSTIPSEDKTKLNKCLAQFFSVSDLPSLCKYIHRNALTDENRVYTKFRSGVFDCLNRKNMTAEFDSDTRFMFEKLKDIGAIIGTV